MSCSLKAQMQRMFMPLLLKTKILPNDLIVTTDVDIFVMTSDIFDEIKNQMNWGKISILQVEQMFLKIIVLLFSN